MVHNAWKPSSLLEPKRKSRCSPTCIRAQSIEVTANASLRSNELLSTGLLKLLKYPDYLRRVRFNPETGKNPGVLDQSFQATRPYKSAASTKHDLACRSSYSSNGFKQHLRIQAVFGTSRMPCILSHRMLESAVSVYVACCHRLECDMDSEASRLHLPTKYSRLTVCSRKCH